MGQRPSIYAVQVDFLLSRLKVLYERIDDTEDLINIELDHRFVCAPLTQLAHAALALHSACIACLWQGAVPVML